jgi:hypothetical protein
MLEMHERIPGAVHFYVYEAACRCGCGFGRHRGDVSVGLIILLEKVRHEINRPLFVNSMCRCEAHNRTVNGVDGSIHILGEAVDLRTVGGGRRHEVEKAGYKYGAMGVGTGKSFIHLDVHEGGVKFRPSSWGY